MLKDNGNSHGLGAGRWQENDSPGTFVGAGRETSCVNTLGAPNVEERGIEKIQGEDPPRTPTGSASSALKLPL